MLNVSAKYKITTLFMASIVLSGCGDSGNGGTNVTNLLTVAVKICTI